MTDGNAGGEFGGVVRSIGDVNGDGFADLAVGASNAASIYFGGPAGLSATPATVISPLPDGQPMTGGGDVNGDGYADLVVVGMNRTLVVYLGSAAGLPTSPSSTLTIPLWPALGISRSELGTPGEEYLVAADLNGDGFGDLVMGSFGFSDAEVYIYLGGPNGPAAAPSATLTAPGFPVSAPPPSTSGLFYFGAAVAAADVDGDGFPELFVTSAAQGAMFGMIANPTIVVYEGDASGVFSSPPRTFPGFYYVAGAGDVNGDGFEDIVAAGGPDSYLFLGSASGVQTSPSQSVPVPPSYANSLVVGGLGDTNGDGYSDAVTLTGGNQYEPGRLLPSAFIFSGAASGLTSSPSLTFHGPASDFNFGAVFAGRQ